MAEDYKKVREAVKLDRDKYFDGDAIKSAADNAGKSGNSYIKELSKQVQAAVDRNDLPQARSYLNQIDRIAAQSATPAGARPVGGEVSPATPNKSNEQK